MNDREQTGIVGCCNYQEYFDGHIKKHELTRTAKENDRVRHVETQNANAEPVFFSYRGLDSINQVIADTIQSNPSMILWQMMVLGMSFGSLTIMNL